MAICTCCFAAAWSPSLQAQCQPKMQTLSAKCILAPIRGCKRACCLLILAHARLRATQSGPGTPSAAACGGWPRSSGTRLCRQPPVAKAGWCTVNTQDFWFKTMPPISCPLDRLGSRVCTYLELLPVLRACQPPTSGLTGCRAAHWQEASRSGCWGTHPGRRLPSCMWNAHARQHELEPCAGDLRHKLWHLKVQMATMPHVRCTQA